MAAPEIVCVDTAGSVQPSADGGVLVINNVVMHSPAWHILDLSPLWEGPAIRGQNVLLPGVPGRRPNPIRIDETSYDLLMVMTGATDHEGNANADPAQGLFDNIAYLRAHVTDPPDPGANPLSQITSRPATLWSPDGTVEYEADVQVMQFRVSGRNGDFTNAALTLRIAAGGFVPVTS